MLETLAGTVTLVSWCRKRTYIPMLVTPLGTVTLPKWQNSNAPSPMLVTLLPMVTVVRLKQKQNAIGPNAGDAVGNGQLVRL